MTRSKGMLLALAALASRRGVTRMPSGLICNVASSRTQLCMLVATRARRQAELRKGRPKPRRWWIRPIFTDHDEKGAWADLIPQMRATDLDKYYNFFRMTPASFDELLGLIEPFMRKRSWRKFICPGERLAITLRYMASGDSMNSLSYLFRVSDQCISTILLETTTLLWSALKNLSFNEISEDMWLERAAEFEATWDIPHCAGAIDGKHVRVQKFAVGGSRFFNYKEYHSIVLMAVADAKYRFSMVDVGGSGRRGDGNIFHECTFGRRLEEGRLHLPPPITEPSIDKDLPFFFVGDAAFSRSKNLMNPFKGKDLLPEENIYNYRLSRARRVVENAFGILAARFTIFKRAIIGSRSLVKSVTLAGTALHNWHLDREDNVAPDKRRYCPADYADYELEDGTLVYGRWRSENPEMEATLFQHLRRAVAGARREDHDMRGEEVAEDLLEYFIRNPLPWQYKKMFGSY